MTTPINTKDPIYYGWVMLPLSMAGVICTSPGQTYTVSVFNRSFREALNLSHTELTAAYMAGTLLAAIPLAYIGALMDRYGPRKTKTGVVLLFGLACFATSQAQGVLTLFCAFFCLRLLGQGALGLISTNALAYWFDKRLGMVTGICSLAVAAAIAVVPGWALALIEAIGWRGAYAAMGLAAWAIMLPLLATLYRDNPEQIGQAVDGEHLEPGARPADAITEPAPGTPGFHVAADTPTTPSPRPVNDYTLKQAARTRAYWIAGLAKAMWAMLATAIFFNLIPLLASRDVPEQQIATLYTLFAAVLALTQLLGGWLADRLPIHYLLAFSQFAVVVALLVIRFGHGVWLVPAAATAMGVAQGILFASLGPLWARYYGRSHLGKIRGSLTSIMVAATSIGPFLMGVTYDYLGGYDGILTAFILMTIPLIPLALAATHPNLIPRARDLSI